MCERQPLTITRAATATDCRPHTDRRVQSDARVRVRRERAAARAAAAAGRAAVPERHLRWRRARRQRRALRERQPRALRQSVRLPRHPEAQHRRTRCALRLLIQYTALLACFLLPAAAAAAAAAACILHEYRMPGPAPETPRAMSYSYTSSFASVYRIRTSYDVYCV